MEPKQKWLALAAVAVGIFMGTVDGSIVNIALPSMVHTFSADFASVQWIALSYLLVLTTLVPSVGRLSDMVGKRPLFAAGFVIFTVASLGCGLAPSLSVLLVARVVQGIGAALTQALGPAIIAETFGPHERGKAMGIAGAAVAVGVVIGPTLGGLLLSVASWHWIFLVNIPIGLVGIVMVLRYVPAITPPGGQRFDFVGAGLLFVALTSLLLALTLGQQAGFGHPGILGFFVCAAVTGPAFVLTQRHGRFPMLDLRLFANSTFSVQLACSFLCFVGMSGLTLLMPFYLQQVLNLSPRDTGILMAVTPLFIAFIGPTAGALSDRLGTGPITRLGLAVIILGCLSLGTLDASTTPLGYVLRFLLVGVGMGIFQAPNNNAIMNACPRAHLGTASGLLAASRTLGHVTGQGALGALWAWRTVMHAHDSNDASHASAVAQVLGLRDTIHTVLGLVAVALLLNVSTRLWRTESAVTLDDLPASPS